MPREVAVAVFFLSCVGAAPGPITAQSLLDRPARLEVEGTLLPDALRLLQQRAAVPLVYSHELLPADHRVSCACSALTVGQALERLLAETGLTFRATRAQVMIVPASAPIPAAAGIVVGRAVDLETGAPAPSVAIRLQSGQGVLADASGRFTLRDVAAGSHRLEVTGMGWEPWVQEVLQVTPGDTVTVLVRLRRGAIPLREILVAPGTFGMLESVPPGVVRVITREEIEAMPQLGEDVFRSLTRLPGVAAHDISTRLSVRGSLDREVMVRLDGLELFEPYHLKDFDGALGIVDLTALAGVELKAGGFGVEYGDRAAGVLDMKSRTALGPAQTTLGLNISHLSALGRGGLADDRGSWLFSARQGSLGLLMKMVGADERISPQFYDLFGKVEIQARPGHRLALRVLHAGDRLRLDGDAWDGLTVGDGVEAGDIRSDWKSSYAWASWDARVRPSWISRTLLWTGRVTRFRQGYQDDFGSIGTPERIAVRDDRAFLVAGFREEVEAELIPDLLVRAGGEMVRSTAEYDYYADTRTPYVTADGLARLRADTVALTLEPGGTRAGLFLAARGRVRDRLTAEVGVRYDRVSQTDEALLSPRASVAMELGAGVALQASAGRFHQSQGIGELQVGDGQTLFAPAERSDLVALGVQRRFGPELSLRLEAYHRSISDQQPRWVGLEQELAIFPEQQGDRLRVDPGRGRVRGVEAFAEGTVGSAWSWSAAYALASAEDEIPQGGPCAGGAICFADPWVPRPRDQRHAINLRAEYRPGPRWEVAAGWTYHSGWPATAWVYGVLPLANGSWFWTRDFGPLNGERLPAYHRLDVRATHAFPIRGGTLEVYLDAFNLYDRRNRGSQRYAGTFLEDGRVATVPTDGGEELLPFLPMFGLRYQF